jgi:phosphate transport system permease protein
MTDAPLIRLTVAASLKRRLAAEARFRALGIGAVSLAILFLAVLIGSVTITAWPAFDAALFTHADSTAPQLAGLLGAVMGSGLALLVAAVVSVPIGILAAVYLEEFAPRNWLTGVVEANLNSLSAAPSIIYGLLGLAVFVDGLGMPRASPAVGGLVLALIALPTVIIATRSCLGAVPWSIREAALGVGASRTQMVFGHVLPTALPGVATGVILALAHALGQAAPLLIVGAAVFAPNLPTGVASASSTAPTQIYTWANALDPAFQARAAAAAIILLVVMTGLNGVAQLLRRRFERGW